MSRRTGESFEAGTQTASRSGPVRRLPCAGRPASRLVSRRSRHRQPPLRPWRSVNRGGPGRLAWRLAASGLAAWDPLDHLRQGSTPGSSLRPPRGGLGALERVAGAANDRVLPILQEVLRAWLRLSGAVGRPPGQQDRAEIACRAVRRLQLAQHLSGSPSRRTSTTTRIGRAVAFHRKCQRCRRSCRR